MANNNGGNVCPKCGTKLGQKNICPICGGPERENDHAGGNGANPSSLDYVSSVIDFVEKHPDDWDDEFNTFYEGLVGSLPDYVDCYEACSKVKKILRIKVPDSGKISGSMTIKVLTDLKSVFPELTNETARALAVEILNKRMEPMLRRRVVETLHLEILKKRMNPGQDDSWKSRTIIPDRDRLERFKQKTEALLDRIKPPFDLDAIADSLKEIIGVYPDYFECCSEMIISTIAEKEFKHPFGNKCSNIRLAKLKNGNITISTGGFDDDSFTKMLFFGRIEENEEHSFCGYNVQTLYHGEDIVASPITNEKYKIDGIKYLLRPSKSISRLPGRNTLVFMVDEKK